MAVRDDSQNHKIGGWWDGDGIEITKTMTPQIFQILSFINYKWIGTIGKSLHKPPSRLFGFFAFGIGLNESLGFFFQSCFDSFQLQFFETKSQTSASTSYAISKQHFNKLRMTRGIVSFSFLVDPTLTVT